MEKTQTRAEMLLDLMDVETTIIHREYASRFVRAVDYNLTTHVMSVWMERKDNTGTSVGEYPHRNVPYELFVEFDACESKGKMYNEVFRSTGVRYYARVSGQ